MELAPFPVPPSVIQQRSHGRTAARVRRPHRPGCPRLLLGPGPQHKGGRRAFFSRVPGPSVAHLGSKDRADSPGISQARLGLDRIPFDRSRLCPPWAGRSGLGRGLRVCNGGSARGSISSDCFKACSPTCINFLVWGCSLKPQLTQSQIRCLWVCVFPRSETVAN